MPFPFVYLCDLLDRIEELCVRDVPLLRKDRILRTKDSIIAWMRTHSWRINAQDTDSSAVLMMLKPERQTDREYGVEECLEQILARIFKMPTPMYERLKRWRDQAHNQEDLGLRLCQILQEMKVTATKATASKISVEEIDQSLLRIAIFNKRSSLAVKSLMLQNENHPDRIEVLEALYTRLQPREAKWVTRIILKSYGPVTLPDSFPLPGNVSHLPNSIPAVFQFPLEPPIPTRWIGTRVKKGIGSKEATHPLPTPPTSSPNLAITERAKVVNKPPARIRIGWNPQFSNLSASVLDTALPAPSTSSPLQVPSTIYPEQPPHTLVSPPHSSPPAVACKSSNPAQTHAPVKRSALGQISSNVPSGSQSQQSQPRSQEKTTATILSNTSSSTRKANFRVDPKFNPSPPTVLSSGRCLLTRSRCQFSSSLLILSPCLLSNPYLLTQLIPYHGAHHLTSLASLSHPSIPQRTKSGRRVRKFILVDITRPEQTLLFCRQAEKAVSGLGWKARNGNSERIPIFDWRILESFAKVDRGLEVGFDPVGRHFQGTI